ncbi:membrane fusion protein of the HefABC efflux system HefB [Helicobacter fennelliae]|uniref:Membrane fusion protein of the HefABC efflux system HefB n=1 Tax=Helicobacter fennelliae TaxID=215 RepID=A0A2X3DJS3_9HELI|nr:HlyD family efflux transporter periplasmic adaptor subunit [Helicobacter fennelliae]SQB99639.1 membrane fusion protein of the HefABC efflux system HefB [Helicobacter fennelliae]
MKKFLIGLLTLGMVEIAWSDDVYAIFNIKAVQDSSLAIDSTGIIDKIFVDVDSVVKKGDQLLVIYNKDKEAQFQAIKEQYLFAKKQYERYNKSGDVVDKNTLDQYHSNYKKLEADYNYYQSLLDKTILRAPFNGVIAEKKVELGDGVNANNTTLFRLVSENKKIVLQFDSKYLSKVQVGDLYEFSIDGAGTKKTATITKIYPTIDESTRKVTAEAAVEGSLKPGLFGDGYIKTK